ncbi:hypothetical protein TEA_005177 [Camellia sinensis var. sinensis]|uniref:Glycosyltransferase 61 catalytic domain-containing protein n=1 Tax=Camellia sinensis var. sinensis TaxID=542762 RepID=A0A4S4DNJ2_CAMSN|nr:hypothetical protein TEA_005177 [Camellia sinensis var. sinensis]
MARGRRRREKQRERKREAEGKREREKRIVALASRRLSPLPAADSPIVAQPSPAAASDRRRFASASASPEYYAPSSPPPSFFLLLPSLRSSSEQYVVIETVFDPIFIIKGNVRTDSLSSSIYLYSSTNANGFIDYVPDLTYDGEEDDEQELQHENIKPYIRKWEKSTVDTYGDILSILSDYPPIDFSGDNRTHCFPEAMAGLRIHDDLTIDPLLMEGGKTTKDFRNILDHAYWPRIKGLIEDEEREAKLNNLSSSSSSQKLLEIRIELKKPKLVILLRQKSRAIANEDLLVKMAEQIGFEVEVLRPVCTFELERIYRELNSSDVTIGVHGAALTHFLFMKLGLVLIQVIPLGTEWASETSLGEPSTKLGLKYIGYKILPRESSLFDEYDENDPVLTNPSNVGKKWWEFTKKIYLDHQNVRLNLVRFQRRLLRAYDYSFAKKNRDFYLQSH